jgi:chaperonin cofactor prefoldin
LAKPNYQYEKRQRDLAKKKKKEEKRLNKLKKKIQPAEGAADTPSDAGAD